MDESLIRGFHRTAPGAFSVCVHHAWRGVLPQGPETPLPLIVSIQHRKHSDSYFTVNLQALVTNQAPRKKMNMPLRVSLFRDQTQYPSDL